MSIDGWKYLKPRKKVIYVVLLVMFAAGGCSRGFACSVTYVVNLGEIAFELRFDGNRQTIPKGLQRLHSTVSRMGKEWNE